MEFALIASPFFFLLFAIVEITMVFFTSTALDQASMEVARKVRTGEFQTAGASTSDFVDQVCAKMNSLIACNGNVSVDIRTFEDFGDVVVNDPIDANGNLDKDAFEFDPGDAGDIVLVRVFYSWKLSTPLIGNVFSNLSGNRRLIVSSLAFRNEPFGG
ncbi:MAG: TadE/TadG family type IV pilus assembly protein [Robiginitomaculum sp.]|nr:TadE/TadG family type IV pilus assembly protein [Robiginitomaculum sp.]